MNKGKKIINFYDKIPKNLSMELHNPFFKVHNIVIPFRMLIIGSSNSGKTNVLLNLINIMPDTFNQIIVCTRNADEPLYNFLKMKLKDNFHIIENLNELPLLDSFDKKLNHLVVFDDMVLTKKQNDIEEYFIRSRKLNISVVYISQSYFKIPKIIRSNVNYIILKKLSSSRDIALILTDYTLALDRDNIIKLYRDATNDKIDFLMIDIDNFDRNKIFRKNFTEFYTIE